MKKPEYMTDKEWQDFLMKKKSDSELGVLVKDKNGKKYVITKNGKEEVLEEALNGHPKTNGSCS